MKCALDIEGAHLGQRVNFEDMVGIRVRNLVRIRLSLNMMRFAAVLRPDSPDADHPNRGATFLVLDKLEYRRNVFGVHDLRNGQETDLGCSPRDMNVPIV